MLLLRDMFDDLVSELNFGKELSDIYRKLPLAPLPNEDKSITFTLSVPGLKESDLKVEVNNSKVHPRVHVYGSRQVRKSTYSVDHSFSVPIGYDPDSLKAELEDGLLFLTFMPLASKPEEKIKQFEVVKK